MSKLFIRINYLTAKLRGVRKWSLSISNVAFLTTLIYWVAVKAGAVSVQCHRINMLFRYFLVSLGKNAQNLRSLLSSQASCQVAVGSAWRERRGLNSLVGDRCEIKGDEEGFVDQCVHRKNVDVKLLGGFCSLWLIAWGCYWRQSFNRGKWETMLS